MQRILERKKIIVCAGYGGVGKTTIAASLAYFSAEKGYRTFVITIDPSYRLKTAFGFDEGFSKKQIHHIKTKAPLFASVLKPQDTFRWFLKRHCKTKESFERLQNNLIYEELSTRLGFYQEFTALIEVYEAFLSKEFDRIILDTPPGPQFMNFLEGSDLISPLFEKRLMRWLLKRPEDQSFLVKLFSQGPLLFMGLVKKFAGSSFLQSLYEFMEGLNEIKVPILRSLSRIEKILSSPHTAYVGVTGEEGELFDIGIEYDALVLNRLLPFPLTSPLKEELLKLKNLNPPLSQGLLEELSQKARYLYQKRDKYAKLEKGKVSWVFYEDKDKEEELFKNIAKSWEESP